MSEFIGAGIGALGNIVGTMMQNSANAKQAAAQMAFQERMAGQQRQWTGENMEAQYGYQRSLNAEARNWDSYMQGTAYQRATTDMRAAGLNPMLAYSQGGAGTGSIGAGSAPSGSVGSGPSGASARMENIMGGAAESASKAAKLRPEVELIQSQAETQTGQAQLIQHQKRLVDAQVGQAQAATALDIARAQTEERRPPNIDANTGLLVQQGRSAGQEVVRFDNYGPRTTLGDHAAAVEAVGRRVAREAAPEVTRHIDRVRQNPPVLTPPSITLPDVVVNAPAAARSWWHRSQDNRRVRDRELVDGVRGFLDRIIRR